MERPYGCDLDAECGEVAHGSQGLAALLSASLRQLLAEFLPVPVRPHVVVHPGDARRCGGRDIVVSHDHAATVSLRKVEPRTPVVDQRDRGVVLGFGEVARSGVSDDLDARFVHVEPPVPRVPRGVVHLHHLVDGAIHVDDVVAGNVRRRALEQIQNALEFALRLVDEEPVDPHVCGAIGVVVVAIVADITVVGAVGGGHDDTLDRLRAFGFPGWRWGRLEGSAARAWCSNRIPPRVLLAAGIARGGVCHLGR